MDGQLKTIVWEEEKKELAVNTEPIAVQRQVSAAYQSLSCSGNSLTQA